jgi:hypothetical protein
VTAFERANATRVIFHLHGNGATVESSYWNYDRLYAVTNATVVGVEYIGYGHLKPPHSWWTVANEADIVEQAAHSIHSWIQSRRRMRIILMGASLGTGVAIQVARALPDQLEALILENAFTSVPDLLGVRWPLSTLIFDHWDSAEHIKHIGGNTTSTSILYLVSESDGIVPPYMTTELVRATSSLGLPMVYTKLLPRCSHGDAPAHPDYLPTIVDFLNKL